MLFACASFAQQSNTPYYFPIKPGSEKWQAFKTPDDMYAACQIPPDVLANLSTAALIQTCLNYPAPLVLFLNNTPQMSFDRWKGNFNGIPALLARRDAPARLLDIYNAYDVKRYRKLRTDNEKGEYRFLRMTMEAIIVQDDIIGNMEPAQKKQLLIKALANLDAIAADAEYGFIHLASTARIIVKLSAALGDEATRSVISSESMQHFIATGMVTDREAFSGAIDKARAIAGK